MKLFREKSYEKLSSPEQLHTYIKVTNLNIWLLLGAVIFLLLGFMIWAMLGTLETSLPIQGMIKDQKMILETAPLDLEHGCVMCAGRLGSVQNVKQEHDQMILIVEFQGLTDGSYSCVWVESISPIKFLGS